MNEQKYTQAKYNLVTLTTFLVMLLTLTLLGHIVVTVATGLMNLL